MITVKLNARVAHICDPETIQLPDKTVTKRTVVFEEAEGPYPVQVAVDWWEDAADLVKELRNTDVVIVEFSVKSRKSKSGRPYTSLSGRDIAIAKREEDDEPAQHAAPTKPAKPAQNDESTLSQDGDWEPPF